MNNNDELKHRVAKLLHEQRSEQIKKLFSLSTMMGDGKWYVPMHVVNILMELANTSYDFLLKPEKEPYLSDADKILDLIVDYTISSEVYK